MSFWDDVADVVETVTRPVMAVENWVAGKIGGIPVVGQVARGNPAGNMMVINGLRGNTAKAQHYRDEMLIGGAVVGTIYAGGVGAGLATSGAGAQYSATGKVKTSSLLAAVGVDPEVASLFPSLDLGGGTDGAKTNPVPGTGGARRAPASAMPSLGGDNNSYMLPVVIIGGAALLALAFYGRK